MERDNRMQISRHWRLNSQRYRLQGVRYVDGEVALNAKFRPELLEKQNQQQKAVVVYSANSLAAD